MPVQSPRNGGFTLTDIADYLDIKTQTVKRIMERCGVELRWHPHPRVAHRNYDALTTAEAEKVLTEYFRARGERELRRREKEKPAEDHPRRAPPHK